MSTRSLVPLRDLQSLPGETGRWQATGCDPQFAIPCNLPAGWVRVRVRLQGDVRGRMEWYTLDAAGAAADVPLERTDYYGAAEREFFVYLPQPVPALRFDPLDVPGTFCIEELHIDALSKLRIFLQALGSKLSLLWRYQRLLPCVANGCRMLLRGDLGTIRHKLLGALARPQFQAAVPYDANAAYARWRETRQASRAATSAPVADGPLLSLLVLMPAGAERQLDQTVRSALRQTYSQWELLLLVQPEAAEGLRVRWRHEPRLRVVEADVGTALHQVGGEAFAFLDPGDALAEDALFRMAEALHQTPAAAMVYSDEDRIGPDGQRTDPIFKPAWSPELLLNTPYTRRLCFYRTALAREPGGCDRNVADLEYSLALRLVETGAPVGHIPDVLYHRAQSSAGWPAPRRLRWPIQGSPRISILIPTAYRATGLDGQATTLLAHCLESIRSRSTHRPYEIIVVDNDRPPAELLSVLAAMEVRRFSYRLPFNWAAAMNQAAAQATGEYLVVLDDDTEVLTPDWLEALLEYGQRPGVGAVGARLLYPDGRLQHAGVALLHGHAIHPFAGLPGDHPGYLDSTRTPRNCSAVTSACMLTPTALFRTLAGFRETFALYCNDIDYCMRLRQAGRRVVYTPHATLRHYEAATKTHLQPREMQVFRELWADRLADDPYYNPNLSADFRDYRIETDPERIRGTLRGVRFGD